MAESVLIPATVIGSPSAHAARPPKIGTCACRSSAVISGFAQVSVAANATFERLIGLRVCGCPVEPIETATVSANACSCLWQFAHEKV